MRILYDLVVDGYLNESVDYPAASLEHMMGYSCQVVWSSTTASYTVKLQGSNDEVNWKDLSGLSQAILNDSGSVLWNVSDAMYQFVRPVVARTSGAVDDLKIVLYCKGV